MQDIATRSHSNLDPEIVSSIQEIIAVSRRAGKTQDSPIGGKELHNLWNDAIDRAATNQRRWYRHEMFKAGVRDGYWDLAQQVRIRSLARTIERDIMLPKRNVVYQVQMICFAYADSIRFSLGFRKNIPPYPITISLGSRSHKSKRNDAKKTTRKRPKCCEHWHFKV